MPHFTILHDFALEVCFVSVMKLTAYSLQVASCLHRRVWSSVTFLWTKLYLLLHVEHIIALRGRKGTVLRDGVVWTSAILLLNITGSLEVKITYRQKKVTEKHYIKSLTKIYTL